MIMGATTGAMNFNNNNSQSPYLPDRKRYAIKANVSLGLYRPSFGISTAIVQPENDTS